MWVETGANRFSVCLCPAQCVQVCMQRGVHMHVYKERDSSPILDPAPALCLRWRHDLEVSPTPANQSPLSSLPFARSTVFPHREVQSSSGYQQEQTVVSTFQKNNGGTYRRALKTLMPGVQSFSFRDNLT